MKADATMNTVLFREQRIKYKRFSVLFVLQLNTENYGVLDLSMSLKDMLKLVAAPSHYYRDWRPINDLRDRDIL
ncbi:MAG: hypothetical protein V2I33_20980, partial [Kangiellaceae bacterium]|nr:hypothetical protein [Kangiellaceae bacterium]